MHSKTKKIMFGGSKGSLQCSGGDHRARRFKGSSGEQGELVGLGGRLLHREMKWSQTSSSSINEGEKLGLDCYQALTMQITLI